MGKRRRLCGILLIHCFLMVLMGTGALASSGFTENEMESIEKAINSAVFLSITTDDSHFVIAAIALGSTEGGSDMFLASSDYAKDIEKALQTGGTVGIICEDPQVVQDFYDVEALYTSSTPNARHVVVKTQNIVPGCPALSFVSMEGASAPSEVIALLYNVQEGFASALGEVTGAWKSDERFICAKVDAVDLGAIKMMRGTPIIARAGGLAGVLEGTITTPNGEELVFCPMDEVARTMAAMRVTASRSDDAPDSAADAPPVETHERETEADSGALQTQREYGVYIAGGLVLLAAAIFFIQKKKTK